MISVTVTERWHHWDGMRYRVWARPVPQSATPPLILIHGYAACVEQWGRFIRDIGPDVPVYAVDLIGFGESSKPRQAPYGRAFYLAQLEHMRFAYGLERVVPVGHSLGGMLGIEWAAERPAAIPSVVAIAPGGLLAGDEFTAWQSAAIRRISTPVVTRALYSFVTHLPYRILSASAYADRAAMDPHTQIALKRGMRSPGAAWSYSALIRRPDAFHATAQRVGLALPPPYHLGHEGRASPPRGDRHAHAPVSPCHADPLRRRRPLSPGGAFARGGGGGARATRGR